MKTKLLAVIAVLVFVIAAPILARSEKIPPAGKHFMFNCVTEANFIDTFDGDLSQWLNVSGTGEIVSDSGNNVYMRSDGSYVGGVAGSDSLADYVLDFDVKKVSGSYFNIVFRYVDQDNHYLLEPSSDEIHIALFKKVSGGGYQELAARPLQETTAGQWYHYKIVADGNSIQVFVDGQLKFDVIDDSLPAGKIGLGAYFGSVVYFDNVRIMAPSEILVPFVGSGSLGFVAGPDFRIPDNDMTDDGQAWVQVPPYCYDTYDQARGKPGGELHWGNTHVRVTKKPVWEQHNNDLCWGATAKATWPFTNGNQTEGIPGVTCYSFRMYPLPLH